MRIMWLAAGAALVYFLDQQRGAKRRNDLRNRVSSKARRGAHGAQGALTDASNRARGAVHEAVSSATPATGEQPNDPTLAAKVETEIFRDPSVPQGDINVSSQNGVIVLIGEVDDTELISALEAATRKVEGVRDVRNLLHAKGTPAPQL